MSAYARGWMFGALCSMSALAGGWAVAATLARGEPSDPDGARTSPHQRPLQAPGAADPSTPSMSDRLYLNAHPSLIAC